jgi:hypothetical protein
VACCPKADSLAQYLPYNYELPKIIPLLEMLRFEHSTLAACVR